MAQAEVGEEAVRVVDVVEALDADVGGGDVDLMSVNCEGCEWFVVHRLVTSSRVRQIKRLQVRR
jgi:hypothetical protein